MNACLDQTRWASTDARRRLWHHGGDAWRHAHGGQDGTYHAGDNGDADAMYALYQAYRDGSGVRKNKKSQAKYLNMAKEAKHPEALKVTEE